MSNVTNICRHCQRVIVRVEYVDGSAYWLHQDGVPIASGGGYQHCRTGSMAGPSDDAVVKSPSQQVWAASNSIVDALMDAMTQTQNPIKDALRNPVTSAPPCYNHVERQHRDQQPPWCNECGWTHGRDAIPVAKLGTPRSERESEA